MPSEALKAGLEAAHLRAHFDALDKRFAQKCTRMLHLVGAHIPEVAQDFADRLSTLCPDDLRGNAKDLFEGSILELLKGIDRPEWLRFASSLAELVADANLHAVIFATTNAIAWKQLREAIENADGCDDPEKSYLVDTLECLAIIHSVAVADASARYRDRSARAEQRENADLFEMDISSTAHIIADQTAILATEMEFAADLSDSVLARTEEVSTASEQSAHSMRDASETASTLMHGVQRAREEVATAALSASRASKEAKESAESMKELDEQSKSINSVLKLIGQIAEQTNILALNATIEAARAGDAGLGFAVVAREVKSLSDQTAEATRQVSESVKNIQEAARTSIASNASICAKVDQVQDIANDISRALVDQERFVSKIAKTVEATSQSADSISEAVSDIRDGTNSVVAKIKLLESGFTQVDKNMVALRENAENFVGKLG